MAEGLAISELTHIEFSEAAQLNAQLPLAYNSRNARTGVKEIQDFVNQTIGNALNGVAEEKDLRALEARVTHNEHEIAQLWEKDDTIDLDVITDASISGNESTVFVETDYANLKTEATSSDSIPLPVASPVQAGVMNAATYNALQTAISDIAGIIGQSWLVMANLGAAATAASAGAAWLNQTGQQPRDGNTVVNIGNNNELWKYGNYQGANQWVLTASSFNLTAFTNTMLGGIKGSLQKYQVSAELDGTGSVNGLDLLESLVNTNANNIANHSGNVDIHVTAADKASWNGKVNWRGDWVAGRSYAIGDMFYHDGRIYVCQIATTTSTDPYTVATRDGSNYFACIDTKDIRDSIKNLSLAGDVVGTTNNSVFNGASESITAVQVNDTSYMNNRGNRTSIFNCNGINIGYGVGDNVWGTLLWYRNSVWTQFWVQMLIVAYPNSGGSNLGNIWFRTFAQNSTGGTLPNFQRLAKAEEILPKIGHIKGCYTIPVNVNGYFCRIAEHYDNGLAWLGASFNCTIFGSNDINENEPTRIYLKVERYDTANSNLHICRFIVNGLSNIRVFVQKEADNYIRVYVYNATSNEETKMVVEESMPWGHFSVNIGLPIASLPNAGGTNGTLLLAEGQKRITHVQGSPSQFVKGDGSLDDGTAIPSRGILNNDAAIVTAGVNLEPDKIATYRFEGVDRDSFAGIKSIGTHYGIVTIKKRAAYTDGFFAEIDLWLSDYSGTSSPNRSRKFFRSYWNNAWRESNWLEVPQNALWITEAVDLNTMYLKYVNGTFLLAGAITNLPSGASSYMIVEQSVFASGSAVRIQQKLYKDDNAALEWTRIGVGTWNGTITWTEAKAGGFTNTDIVVSTEAQLNAFLNSLIGTNTRGRIYNVGLNDATLAGIGASLVGHVTVWRKSAGYGDTHEMILTAYIYWRGSSVNEIWMCDYQGTSQGGVERRTPWKKANGYTEPQTKTEEQPFVTGKPSVIKATNVTLLSINDSQYSVGDTVDIVILCLNSFRIRGTNLATNNNYNSSYFYNIFPRTDNGSSYMQSSSGSGVVVRLVKNSSRLELACVMPNEYIP
jgi:hypothetical protein